MYGAYFFTLSLGLGLPLFILALFSGKLDKLPRSGEWMIWVRHLMGWVLAAMAAYFLRPLLSQTVSVLLYCIIALSAAVHLVLVDKSKATFAGFTWIKNGVGVFCLLFVFFLGGSWFLRGPGVVWQPYSVELLEQARQQQRPVIIDFYATWCAPCRELDEITFHEQAVVQETGKFLMIKIDLTKGDNPVYQALLRDYKVKGVPTIVFLGSDGGERLDLRLVDFMKPKDFIVHMKKAL